MEVSPEALLKMSDEEVDKIIRIYFTAETWNSLISSERLQNRQIYINYASRLKLANSTEIPPFFVSKDGRPEVHDSITNIDKRETKNKGVKKAQMEKGNKKSKSEAQEGKKVRKNPERTSKMVVNYYEEDEPEEDRYIYCDTCKKEVVDYCSTCGMLVMVNDITIPMGEPERARKTIPTIFEIQKSRIHGFGVFALRKIPLGIQMGPYEGTVSRISNTTGYSWKLRNGKLIDAADETMSNWMRYVNCAPHSSVQNVVAFQYKGDLFYRTARAIEPGEELLVYYGNSFARELGIEPKKYFDPEYEESQKNFFTCKYCCIGLSMLKYKNVHETRCSFRREQYYKGKTFECSHCKLLYTREDDKNQHQARCHKRTESKKSEKNTTKNGERKFCCDKCSYETKCKESLVRHIRIHDKVNAPKYSCKLSPYQAIQNSNLKRHLKTHNCFGLICMLCQKSFKRKDLLDSHYVSRHPDRSDKWGSTITHKIKECPKCPYKTVKTSNFKDHLATHGTPTDQARFKCNICGYKCIQKGDFKKHLRLHVGQLPFVCTECDKRFNRKEQLDGHIISRHSENEQLISSVTNKVHQCVKCDYTSIRNHHFKRHLKTCS